MAEQITLGQQGERWRGGLGGSEAYSKLSRGEGMLRQVEISKTINEKKKHGSKVKHLKIL